MSDATSNSPSPAELANEQLQRYKALLAQHCAGAEIDGSVFKNQVRVVVSAAALTNALTALKQSGFDQLTDITAVDLLEYGNATDRFEVVYCLLNVETGERIVVKTHVNDPEPKLPSACTLWFGADWLEREVYDMYGIAFVGHPNFKRLLLPEQFASFPLRKDYPVKGRGERHNFPVITRADS